MKHRNLRLAWSIAWGVIAILLIVSWIRGYWRWDEISAFEAAPAPLTFGSVNGKFYFYHMPRSQPDTATTPLIIRWVTIQSHKLSSPRYFFNFDPPTIFALITPSWIPVLICLASVPAPWVINTYRFSLRTLLIATTLVATGLGVIVWIHRADK